MREKGAEQKQYGLPSAASYEISFLNAMHQIRCDGAEKQAKAAGGVDRYPKPRRWKRIVWLAPPE